MRQAVKLLAFAVLTMPLMPAHASLPREMIGEWRWEQYTVAVSECRLDRLCAKVIAGPKNVGMEIFASNLIPKADDLVGQIVHPDSKEIYNTRFHKINADTWRLDGCIAMRVCLSGEFTRVK